MLDQQDTTTEMMHSDSWEDHLTEILQEDLLDRFRHLGTHVMTEFLRGADLPPHVVSSRAPMPIRPFHLCQIMEPFLCMN
ncbi:MAG: hypothetical protein ACE5IK_00815 [Acidobacteriota bacterium]